MDHVLEKLMDYFELYMDDFILEHLEKSRERLTDNSHYEEVKTLIDAMNPLRKHLGWKPLTLNNEVKNRISEVRFLQEVSKK